MSFQPLIIIGAGRSGTNILRDTLTALPGWATWDCDEINLIWRHGNTRMPHDVFTSAQANPAATRYITKQFAKIASQENAKVVVEKTCANSLRIPFIHSILPQARYIYIVRDGRDVALSAAKRWTSSIEPAYLFKKLRYVPLSDVPIYAKRFVANRLFQYRDRERRQAAWGPVFPSMKEWVNDRPLIEVCAKQWAYCVQASDESFSDMPENKWIKVSYESLVKDPAATLHTISDWYGEFDMISALPAGTLQSIHAGSLNGWKKRSDQFTSQAIEIMAPVLQRHGYDAAP